MKTTANLTHEKYGTDRIYILWDNVKDKDGNILDSSEEVQSYIDEILEDSCFQVMENDDSVASYYGYDNCIITGIDE